MGPGSRTKNLSAHCLPAMDPLPFGIALFLSVTLTLPPPRLCCASLTSEISHITHPPSHTHILLGPPTLPARKIGFVTTTFFSHALSLHLKGKRITVLKRPRRPKTETKTRQTQRAAARAWGLHTCRLGSFLFFSPLGKPRGVEMASRLSLLCLYFGLCGRWEGELGMGDT